MHYTQSSWILKLSICVCFILRITFIYVYMFILVNSIVCVFCSLG